MSFDGGKSHAAAIQATKEKTNWHAFLTYWVAVLASVAFGAMAFQAEKVNNVIEAHNKIIEHQMRQNDTSMLVTERALALFEYRQAAEKAREMKLRASED